MGEQQQRSQQKDRHRDSRSSLSPLVDDESTPAAGRRSCFSSCICSVAVVDVARSASGGIRCNESGEKKSNGGCGARVRETCERGLCRQSCEWKRVSECVSQKCVTTFCSPSLRFLHTLRILYAMILLACNGCTGKEQKEMLLLFKLNSFPPLFLDTKTV